MDLSHPPDELLRKLAQAATSAIAILDGDHRIRYVNPTMGLVLGKPADELIGSIEPRIIPEIPLRTQPLQEQPWTSVAPRHLVTSEGEFSRTYELEFFALFDDSGTHSATGIIAQDVTDRDQALHTLDFSQRAALIGTWNWRPRTNTFTGSHQMHSLIDHYPPEGVVDAAAVFGMCFDPADSDLARQFMQQGLREAQSITLEVRIRTTQTPSRWLRLITAPDSRHRRTLSGTAQDITAERRRLEETAIAQQRFRHAFDDSIVATALTALDGQILNANTALLRMLGYTPDELEHLSMNDILLSDDRKVRERIIGDAVSGAEDSFQLEAHILRGDGVFMWISRHITVLRDPDGSARELLTQMVDATEQHRTEEQLRRLADHDPLTDVLNRRSFDEIMRNHVEHDRRAQLDTSLLLIDIDDFKSVNDHFGHSVGDRVLSTLADILRAQVRATDAVGRYGGDEFVVLLPETDLIGAQLVATKIADEARRRLVAFEADPPEPVSISIGIASLNDAEQSGLSLIIAADRAMYEAKRRPGTKFEVFRGNRDAERTDSRGL